MALHTPHFDVIVVGSGFGGAVASSRLAERGMRVLVLERGPWWGATGSWGDRDRHRALPHGVLGARRTLRGLHIGTRSLTLRSDGIYEVHQFEKLTCLVASGVGGGSLVYTNMIVPPPEGHFDAYPPEITSADMDSYFTEVRECLRPAPDLRPHPKALAFKRAVADTLNGEVQYPDLAIDFDRGNGGAADHPCLMGSRDLSKRSLDHSYLRRAAESGATIQAMCEVETLTPPALTGEWQIRYRDQTTGRSHVVGTDRVVLAAGTLGTLRLLFSARDSQRTLPRLSPTLGRGFTPNGDMASLVVDASEPISSDTGPTITSFHRVDRERSYLTGEFGLPKARAPFRDKRSRTAILFSMGADKVSSEVSWNDGSLHCDVSQQDDPELYSMIATHATRIAAGYRARRVIPNAPFGPKSQRLFSVHPLGGLPMGEDSATSVMNHTGEVHNYSGLYVADGSIVQAAPGVPPSMTIAALAARQSDLITNSRPARQRKATQ